MMEDTRLFEKLISRNTLYALKEIFEKAISLKNKEEQEILNKDLITVINSGKRDEIKVLSTSPNGYNHIVIVGGITCILVNIWGTEILFEDYLLDEGELTLKNIDWIEDDKLLLFDIEYELYDKRRKCICHYGKKKPFVYFSEKYPYLETAQPLYEMSNLTIL